MLIGHRLCLTISLCARIPLFDHFSFIQWVKMQKVHFRLDHTQCVHQTLKFLSRVARFRKILKLGGKVGEYFSYTTL